MEQSPPPDVDHSEHPANPQTRTVADGCLEVCVMGCSQGCVSVIAVGTLLTGSLVTIVAYFAG